MRRTIQNLEESKIREVANAGMDRKDVLAFWFGEPDEVTPDFIRSAASESLLRGETFYSHNLGLPELRSTVASYLLGDSITQFSTAIGLYLFALGIGAYLSRFIDRHLCARFIDVELAVALYREAAPKKEAGLYG